MAEESDATATDEDGAGSDDKTKEKGPATIEDALAQARATLEKKGSMMATDDDETGDEEEEADGEEEGEDGEEDEEEEAGEEEGVEDEEGDEDEKDETADADADADADEVGDEDEEEDEEEEDEEKKRHSVKLPSREADGEEFEIEVDDEETAERLNQMRNGFMRGEEHREKEANLQIRENELATISEAFEVDPAGFLMEYTEATELPQIALALLVQEGVWEKLEAVVDKLIGDPKELRTLQAEAKASRLETVAELKTKRETRAEQTKNGQQIRDAIDLIVPESMVEATRTQLLQDLTRDLMEHIQRNKLGSLEVKDIPTIVAARLESNGIDPLDARTAIKDGARSRGRLSTKKGPKKKPKSGKELVKASAKRRKVAAAPGAGKATAPTQPTKLPAGQSIKERLATVRKAGGMGKFLTR